MLASTGDGTVSDVSTLEDRTFASALGANTEPQVREAGIGGLLARGAKWAWNGAKYAWKNTNFDGPEPGAFYLNGRIVGVRWKQSQWGARLDVHPLPGSGGRPVLHINYGPLGKGEAAHVKLFDPNWLGRP